MSSNINVLTDEQYRKLMLGEQYGLDSDGNLGIIPQDRLMEQALANLNLNNPNTNKVRGGKSKRKKSRSNKRKNRRATKTRRYRK